MDTPNTPSEEHVPEGTSSEPVTEPKNTPPMPEVLMSAPPQAPKYAFSVEDVETNKYIAALSYLGILVFIPLFLKRDSAFARVHAAQGVLLLIAEVIGMFVFWIPVIGWFLGFLLFIADVMALVLCLKGEFWEVPVIGEYRKKLQLDTK